MLGKYVELRVVKTVGSSDGKKYIFPLNFATVCDIPETEYAFILGEDRAVSYFDGRIIGLLETKEEKYKVKRIWLAAAPDSRYINIDIIQELDLENEFKDYKLTCLYESSSGAIVYRYIKGIVRFLLIQNKGSKSWGFPKGHLEMGETRADAARREVLEETSINVKIHLGFEGVSEYTLSNGVEKRVSIFVGTTEDKTTKIQYKEILKFVWLPYNRALTALSFDNDREILKKANTFLMEEGYLPIDHYAEDYKDTTFYKEHKEQFEKLGATSVHDYYRHIKQILEKRNKRKMLKKQSEAEGEGDKNNSNGDAKKGEKPAGNANSKNQHKNNANKNNNKNTNKNNNKNTNKNNNTNNNNNNNKSADGKANNTKSKPQKAESTKNGASSKDNKKDAVTKNSENKKSDAENAEKNKKETITQNS